MRTPVRQHELTTGSWPSRSSCSVMTAAAIHGSVVLPVARPRRLGTGRHHTGAGRMMTMKLNAALLAARTVELGISADHFAAFTGTALAPLLAGYGSDALTLGALGRIADLLGLRPAELIDPDHPWYHHAANDAYRIENNTADGAHRPYLGPDHQRGLVPGPHRPDHQSPAVSTRRRPRLSRNRHHRSTPGPRPQHDRRPRRHHRPLPMAEGPTPSSPPTRRSPA